MLVPVLLLLAALFAASEAALFSLSRAQLEMLKSTRPGVYRRIRALIFRPDALLSTIVIGNECLNIMIATLVTSFLELSLSELSDTTTIILSVLVSSALLLTVSEILPKILAFRMPMLLASILVYPMTWAHWLLAPLRKIFLSVSNYLLNLLGIQVAPPSIINEQDFLTLVEVGEQSGSLDRDEKEMISNVFSFSDLSVSSILTGWDKVFWLPEELPLSEILERIKAKPFSRIPIYSSTKGRVIGILYTKELLKLLLPDNQGKETEILDSALFPAYIVSGHKKVSKLFREFKQKKVHMALVVDEFGKQLGIVTLEDVLNSLFRTPSPRKKGDTP